jgi:uncharacterized membrane protein YfcA
LNHFFLIIITGFAAGAINAIAGGGSFITFPALVYAGLPPINANASSTVALIPGAAAGTIVYKEHLKPFAKVSWLAMILLTLLGGATGSWLLLYTPSSAFNAIVPWLLLTSAITFAFGARAGNLLRKRVNIGPEMVYVGQLLLGVYGGYFGGAVGIMMMAVWTIFGITDIKLMTANRTFFVFLANGVAVLLFMISGKVIWPQTLAMMFSSIAGGYLGALFSKKLDPVKLRYGIVVFNFLITALFFYRMFW